jgi:GR25 family glycosyltransferase involved in LPS biosynthesis/exopolysaccharide biosynthesis predicted pyruvyltransferase EpsI
MSLSNDREIPVYIISVPGAEDKLEQVRKQFDGDSRFELQSAAAVLGRSLPDLVCLKLTNDPNSVNNKGALGCFLSHVRVWERVAMSSAKFSLVLEDDVILHDLARLADLHFPEDMDLAFVNDRTRPPVAPPTEANMTFCEFRDALPAILERNQAIGTDGYIITPEGARKLVDKIQWDLYFGHVDMRMGAYSINDEDLAKFDNEPVARELRHILNITNGAETTKTYVGWPSLTTHIVENSTRLREDAIVAAEKRKLAAEAADFLDDDLQEVESQPLAGLRSVIADFLKQFKGEEVAYFPNPGSGGDSMISCGTYTAFAKARIVARTVSIDDDVSDRTLFIGGGGNLVPLYKDIRAAIERFAGSAKRIVILPHTIRGNQDLLRDLGGNVTIFCRDIKSLQYLESLRLNCDVILAHDMSFHINARQILDNDALSMRTTDTWVDLLRNKEIDEESIGNKKHMNMIRSTKDSISRQIPNLDIAGLFSLGITKDHAYASTWCILKTLSLLESVETDRMHVAIASGMLNLSCNLRDNAQGDNGAVYDTSLKDNFPNVRFKL